MTEAFKPEKVTYITTNRPELASKYNVGVVVEINEDENKVTVCRSQKANLSITPNCPKYPLKDVCPAAIL